MLSKLIKNYFLGVVRNKMSVTVSNCAEINGSNINNSPSKHLFSFSKAERFQCVSPYHTRISYEPSQEFGKTLFSKNVPTTFGVQRPELFYSKEKLAKPASCRYTLNTQFENRRSYSACRNKSLSERKTVQAYNTTFGVGRAAFDKVKSNAGCNYEVTDKRLPGPGYYTPSKKEQKDRYTMRPKTTKESK
jgi:hypothetical protein